MAMTKISEFTLHNGGGFVCRISATFLDDNGEKKRANTAADIQLGITRNAKIADLGVPDGSIVSLYASVALGYDNEAQQSYIADFKSAKVANYTITGTTLNNTLGLVSVG
jgi:hypothetical protein